MTGRLLQATPWPVVNKVLMPLRGTPFCFWKRASPGTVIHAKNGNGSGSHQDLVSTPLARRLVFAASLALAGCKAVGPDYHGPPKPDSPDPAKYKNSNAGGQWKVAEPDDKNPRGQWWDIFQDKDLDWLEGIAANGNQDLRLSVARLAESRAQARVAASDFYPHADFDGTYNRQRLSNNDPYQTGRLVNPKTIGGASSGATSGPLTLTQQPLTRTDSLFREPVDLTWEVDLFGRVRRNYEAARATRQAAEADAVNVNLSVTANVAVMYFNLRAADSEVAVIETP